MVCLTFVRRGKCFGFLPGASVPPWDHFWQQISSAGAGNASVPAGAVLLLGLFPWSLIQVNSLLFALVILITKMSVFCSKRQSSQAYLLIIFPK